MQRNIGPVLGAIYSPDGQTSLTVSNQKDISLELSINIVTTSIYESVRVWRMSTGESIGIIVRQLRRPIIRTLCAADVILDDVAGLSSNNKKVLTLRGAIDSSSTPRE